MQRTARRIRKSDLERPDIFGYHELRAFLRDWFVYLKKVEGLSLRAVAAKAQLGSGYLPMIVNGKRSLTPKTLARLLPCLRLTPPEQTYLGNLARLSSKDIPSDKVIALSRMRKSQAYQKKNPAEAEFITYMSNWYYIVIREMAALPDFVPDPEWIQKRLRSVVPIADIKSALDFLLRHGYLRVGMDGTSVPPKEALDCAGPVYTEALSQYHKQIFSLATESIDKTPPSERDLDGCTIALNKTRFEKARAIINRAMEEIVALEKGPDGPAEEIYHLEFTLFPTTKKDGKS